MYDPYDFSSANLFSSTPAILANGADPRLLAGWVPDFPRIAAFARENGSLFTASPRLANTAHKDVFLWNALMQVKPSWRRGAQGIGDCVAWGSELAVTTLMALMHVKGQGQFYAEAATESIYGGCRVEALGKSRGGRSDGAFGAAAAKWVRDWGCICRVDMGKITGNAEHDLRVYSAKKAKEWGDYGCGGANDRGALDGAARGMPLQHVVQIQTVAECEAAIANGYPVTIASMAGFGSMRRDDRGICKIVDRWPHQMVILGVRFRGGQPEFRIFQSWGDSCGGPDPGVTDKAISNCSWWSTAEDIAWILKTGDCWAYGDIKGLPPQVIPVTLATSTWYQAGAEQVYSLQV